MLEQAISCYDEALVIYDPLTVVSDYAMTLQNKAVALQSLARLNAGAVGIQLIEQAIDCYDRALEIRNRLAMSMTPQFANTQLNKGLVLDELDERRGATEAGGLLEQAIACYDVALKIYTPAIMAPDYARAQQSKGTALYRLAERRGGIEALRLLEQAIVCYDRALEVRNRMTMTPQYANTQINKAVALNELAERRGRAEARDLLEQAIACYDVALAIYDPLTTAPDYAKAQQNKGNALSRLAGLAGVASIALLQQAIACYDAALTIYDPVNSAPDYAKAQQNKGIALRRLSERRAGTEGITLLKQAIACYDEALMIFDPSTMTPEYALALKSKGIALSWLSERIDEREAIPILEQAALSFSIALHYFPQSIAPLEHRSITGLLAEVQLTLAMSKSNPTVLLNRALNTVNSGLETAHFFETLAPSLEFRQEEWSKNADLYATAGAIQALSGAIDEAIILLETGRARGLIEALGRQSADHSLLDSAEREEYESAAKVVLDLEARGRRCSDFREALILAPEAERANARLTSIVEQLQKTHPTFLTTTTLSREMLVAGLHPDEVLIYLIPHDGGTFMLSVPHEGQPRAEWLRELTLLQLHDLMIHTNEEGYYTLGYIPAIFGLGPTLLEEALDGLLPELGERLMRRVVQRAYEFNARHIIMIAGDWFSIGPLHAATYVPLLSDQTATAPKGKRYACDDVLITYTPSGTTYIAAREAAKRSFPIHHGFVVGNPKQTPSSEPLWEPGMAGYLPYAVEEAEEVASVMRAAGLTVTCKIGGDATWTSVINGLKDTNIAHLALHAEFDLFDPLASALLIAPQAKLFLRDLLDPNLVSLTNLRLAILSACQSGLRDIYEMSEESLGLFGALLAAGAAGVVGTLWPVYDYSTKLLMEEFTHRYLEKGQEPAIALRNSIRWLRRFPDEIPADSNGFIEDHSDLAVDSKADSPYRASLAHPVHWASFVYYGA